MKKKIIIILMLIVSMVTMVSARCYFDGKEPSHRMQHSGEYIVSYEKHIRTVCGEVYNLYYEGDVWVIFLNAQAAQKYRFHTTNGGVQYCYDY